MLNIVATIEVFSTSSVEMSSKSLSLLKETSLASASSIIETSLTTTEVSMKAPTSGVLATIGITVGIVAVVIIVVVTIVTIVVVKRVRKKGKLSRDEIHVWTKRLQPSTIQRHVYNINNVKLNFYALIVNINSQSISK